MKQFDTLAYFVLFGGLIIGALGILRVGFDAMRQFWIILMLCLFYLLWGIGYHQHKGDLTRRLFLEYLILVAIATAAGFLVFIR